MGSGLKWWWGDLAAPHCVYLIATIEAFLAVLVWRHLANGDYVGWRDCVQVIIRLVLIGSPANYAVWKLAVDVEPWAWLSMAPQWLASLALAPVVLNSMFVTHMLAVGFAHPLPLWPHALMHCALAVVIARDLDGGCSSRFASHLASKRVMEQAVGLFHLLSFKGFFGASTSLNHGYAWDCRHAALMLQLLVGLLESLAAQATSDAAAIAAFKRWQQRQRRQAAALQQRVCSLYDTPCDVLSELFLEKAAAAARRLALWMVMAVLLWNA